MKVMQNKTVVARAQNETCAKALLSQNQKRRKDHRGSKMVDGITEKTKRKR